MALIKPLIPGEIFDANGTHTRLNVYYAIQHQKRKPLGNNLLELFKIKLSRRSNLTSHIF